MDPLADIFTALRVKSVTYKRLEATAPWGLNIGSYLDAKFGMVIRGACWITVLDNSKPTLLTEGDCYIVAHGTPYILHDSPKTPASDFLEVVNEQKGSIISYGGGGTSTSLIGGRFLFDGPGRQSLTNFLPSLYVKLKASPLDKGPEQAVHLLKESSNTPGKGYFLHTARPIKKARSSPTSFLKRTGHQRVTLRAPQYKDTGLQELA